MKDLETLDDLYQVIDVDGGSRHFPALFSSTVNRNSLPEGWAIQVKLKETMTFRTILKPEEVYKILCDVCIDNSTGRQSAAAALVRLAKTIAQGRMQLVLPPTENYDSVDVSLSSWAIKT